MTDTKAHWAAPFRKDEAALRGEMDDVLKCMKKDGTIAKLSQKWFGATPAPDDLENVAFPGHGVPGLRPPPRLDNSKKLRLPSHFD